MGNLSSRNLPRLIARAVVVELESWEHYLGTPEECRRMITLVSSLAPPKKP